MSFKRLQPGTDHRDKSMTNPKWLSDEKKPRQLHFEEQNKITYFLGTKVTVEIYGNACIIDSDQISIHNLKKTTFLIRLF